MIIPIRRFTILISFFVTCACVPLASRSAPPTPVAAPASESATVQLERERLAFQMQLEQQKLDIERQKIFWTAISIAVPLLLGVLTLVRQTNQRSADARDAFELKAAEIIFAGDSPIAAKNRAGALRNLFPSRFSFNFGNDFKASQFAGPRYEAKLEVFKAACEKVATPEDVYQVWHKIYPGDAWIRPLVGLAQTDSEETDDEESRVCFSVAPD